MHLAKDGDLVWGSGVNGKVRDDQHDAERLDVRAVRGPQTARWLRNRGIECPDVFGDPGLLVASLLPELAAQEKSSTVAFVPNMHDHSAWSTVDGTLVNPKAAVEDVVAAITGAEVVVASSLHGIVIAEAFGLPAVRVVSSSEPDFKYRDYYEGTGRELTEAAPDVETAMRWAEAGRLDRTPLRHWDAEALVRAFPRTSQT